MSLEFTLFCFASTWLRASNKYSSLGLEEFNFVHISLIVFIAHSVPVTVLGISFSSLHLELGVSVLIDFGLMT